MQDKSRRDVRTQEVPPVSPSQALPSPATSRRRFLFALGMTGAGAAAASAVAITTATAPSVALNLVFTVTRPWIIVAAFEPRRDVLRQSEIVGK